MDRWGAGTAEAEMAVTASIIAAKDLRMKDMMDVAVANERGSELSE